MRPLALFAIAAAAASPAFAQDTFLFDSDPAKSSASGSLSIAADSDGTLIGDFDPKTNPDGTQTRPGLFGGSGNNPIAVSLDPALNATLDSTPESSLKLTYDEGALTFDITGFTLDALAGSPAEADITLTLLTETFRTINPSFLYPGGIPIPIPLGGATLDSFTVTQSGPITLPFMIPVGVDSYALSGALPAQLLVTGSALGFELPATPSDILFPFNALLTVSGPAPTLTIDLDLAQLSETADLSASPPIENLPLPLPTLGAEVANTLLTIQFTEASVTAAGAISVVSTGQPCGCSPADLADPLGVLDFNDVVAFLTAFSAMDPSADLADPIGAFDFNDVVVYLTLFSQGCP